MRLSIVSTFLIAASSSISVTAKNRVNRRCVSKGDSPKTLIQLPNGNVTMTTSVSSTRSSRPTSTTSVAANGDKGGSPAVTQSSTTSSTKDSKPTSGSDGNTGSSGSSGSGNGPVMKLQDNFEGKSFFDGFNFNTFPDPTHGFVKYLPGDKAREAGLAYVQDDGAVVMKVDNTNTYGSGGLRPSVRIQSKRAYSSGLIVFDVQSMPYGCGVWPAFWTVGQNWPNGGEIDILEGVNNQAHNQYTLHTSSGCTLDTSFAKSSKKRHHHMKTERRANPNSVSAMAFTGKTLHTVCDARVNGNAGCGIQDPNDKSYGKGLNDNGGGVFATLISNDGVAIWFFPRGSVPDDLTNKKPQPSGWSSPKAFWSSNTCPTGKFFGAQSIVINTTLCGDWAGNTYSSDKSCPGTCADRIKDPRNFDTAQWKINSVRVYN